jgi:hypothetical protein
LQDCPAQRRKKLLKETIDQNNPNTKITMKTTIEHIKLIEVTMNLKKTVVLAIIGIGLGGPSWLLADDQKVNGNVNVNINQSQSSARGSMARSKADEQHGNKLTNSPSIVTNTGRASSSVSTNAAPRRPAPPTGLRIVVNP